MNLIIIATVVLIGLPMYLRGGGLHNHLVREVRQIFQEAGFCTREEHPIHIPNGHLDFIDLLVKRGDCSICVEVETSARHVLSNAAKAEQAGLPMWIIVPNRKVRKAVANKLDSSSLRPGGLRIYILLLGQLEQQLMKYFP